MKAIYQKNCDWKRVARDILQPQEVILVIGSTDVGKSTFCRFLVEEGVSQGLQVGFVDADVGQSQIGPPTTIGFKLFSELPNWLDTTAEDLYFVGSTSPERHLLQCITGVRLMVDVALATGADVVIIDTTGYVEGSGAIALKQHKIELVRPSVLVCIQRFYELDPIVAGFDACDFMQVHHLSPPQTVTSKTNEFRRKHREASFNHYFSETVEEILPFEQVCGQRTTFLAGRPVGTDELKNLSDLAEDRVLYAAWVHRTLVLVTRTALSTEIQVRIKSHLGLTNLVAEVPDYFENRCVGLVNSVGKMVSLGIIQTVDFQANYLRIRCKAGAASATKLVQFGQYQQNCQIFKNTVKKRSNVFR